MWTQSFYEQRFGYGAAISTVMLLLSSVFAVTTCGAPVATRSEGRPQMSAVIRRVPPTKVVVTVLVLACAAAFAYPAFLTVVTSLKTQDNVS